MVRGAVAFFFPPPASQPPANSLTANNCAERTVPSIAVDGRTNGCSIAAAAWSPVWIPHWIMTSPSKDHRPSPEIAAAIAEPLGQGRSRVLGFRNTAKAMLIGCQLDRGEIPSGLPRSGATAKAKH